MDPQPAEVLNLPADIIRNIFTRLPAKFLMQFRCVSKRWGAVIDSPEFVKEHLNRSVATGANLHLILGGESGNYYSAKVASLDCVVQLNAEFDARFTLSGSCNGLLLLERGRDEIFLLNPSTRKYKKLPNPLIPDPGYLEYTSICYGFGYDPVCDDYKVFLVMEFRDGDDQWIKSETRVYSLKSNSWKCLRDFPYSLPYRRVNGVHVKGAVHMVVAFGRENLPPGREIVAFDLRTEGYRTVPKPDYEDKNCVGMITDVLGGCLCLTVIYCEYRVDMWVMKEYGVKESWVKLVTLAPPMVEDYATLAPIAYSTDGKEVLLNHKGITLIWYHLETKTVRKDSVRGLSRFYCAGTCVGSLVLLDGDGETANRNKQLEQEGKFGDIKKQQGEEGKICEIKKQLGQEGKVDEIIKQQGEEAKIGEIKKQQGQGGRISEIKKQQGEEGKIGEIKNLQGQEGKISEIEKQQGQEGKIGEIKKQQEEEKTNVKKKKRLVLD
ncbi:hypothetical protein RJ639_030900 [Escallonia herrerae]|uniref:F-box domain-containing protein n=1 Tax=Escallonia herrerae TaxID=1293975 RepID=A0AA88XEE0_9ASTE|nr:hypothetical protein RJ639_030900 [Escallonia herrerae]